MLISAEGFAAGLGEAAASEAAWDADIGGLLN
jgi:hypothetical protein